MTRQPNEVPINPVLRAIQDRRSVRSGFSARPVSHAVLEQVALSGLAAPSSKNAQPWRLHIADAVLLADLAEEVDRSGGIETYVPHDPRTGLPHPQWKSTVRESAEVLRQVAAGIFIENCGAFSGGRSVLAAASPAALAGSLEGYTFEIVGIGAAVENMWLAANSLGLSAAFMGDVVIAEHTIRRRLGFDGDLIGVLALGYAAAGPSTSVARSPRDGEARVVWHNSADALGSQI